MIWQRHPWQCYLDPPAIAKLSSRPALELRHTARVICNVWQSREGKTHAHPEAEKDVSESV